MNISKKNTEAVWFKFGKTNSEVEFLIRPFKFSVMKLDDVSHGMAEQFRHCIMDWKGLNDDDNEGKPLECNDENKEFLYDYYDDVRDFVFKKQEILKKKIGKQEKNSKT